MRKVDLSLDEQQKYEVIKAPADDPARNKQNAAKTLGCTIRHINRMISGYKKHGKAFSVASRRQPLEKTSGRL